jgi:hypothetical protein
MASRTLVESPCLEGVSHIVTASVDHPGESTFWSLCGRSTGQRVAVDTARRRRCDLLRHRALAVGD